MHKYKSNLVALKELTLHLQHNCIKMIKKITTNGLNDCDSGGQTTQYDVQK
ncbi:hypothetical protein IM793_03715 [Pedobacter sp. MR2016-19]|uniref:hypothetical protein n=1 Tax=Pedobacter sp. MR2016-19 TaxID=2780089 RepID=UPI00187693FA|nr:hypothetical protein [Pedobacter sp. MR2016-19]MBE5318254.1 hypothetical protein [Pedobacter sp. MR2016-19]